MRSAGVLDAACWLVAAGALGAFVACGGDDSRPPATPTAPLTTAPTTAATDAGPPNNVDSTPIDTADSTPPAPRAPREPSYGASSVRPGDPHAFRLAVATKATRANRSGASILSLVSALPEVAEQKAHTGIDPYADSEWSLVYGPDVRIPGSNANVVRHVHPETDVTRALAGAGYPPADAGPKGSVSAVLYGSHEILMRPQAGILAMVPADRASDLAAALGKPIDLGVKAGELARGFIDEPASVFRFLPQDVTHANLSAKGAADGGLDLAVDADCGDAARCSATASDLNDLVTRSNTMMVRIASRGILSGLAIRADGTKLKATLHATPEQVEQLTALGRAQLGLPAPPPTAPAPPAPQAPH